MTRRVAFQPVFGTSVAIVEVSRSEVYSPEQAESLAQRFAQLPQFRQVPVVLGVPHEGLLEADFYAPQDLRMALKKIGWIRLGFSEIKLPY